MVDKLIDQIMWGDDSGPLLGLAVVVRALASAGEGDLVAAEWDWWLATSLDPKLARLDLQGYGEAGRRLEAIAAKRAERQATAREGWSEESDGGSAGDSRKQQGSNGCPEGSELSPPVKVEAAQPKYPKGKRVGRVAESLKVRIEIDSQGRARRPEFPSEVDPVLATAALETLREWRFQPATCGTRPVSVYYVVTLNFLTR
ncbi:MAG TPA: energy transducer TonB [Thermoanaerobaculia bacterium]|nr:energy transducer TonB [Thermoanaerobaculia bacterium]